MTLPQPVPDAALQRLRRSYALLMLALGLPVAAAMLYVLALQFEIVALGTQRQIAMSTERRVTRLDAVLVGRQRCAGVVTPVAECPPARRANHRRQSSTVTIHPIPRKNVSK